MAQEIILTEQSYDFALDSSTGLYYATLTAAFVEIIPNATYCVVWDDDKWDCVATESTLGNETGVALGNLGLLGLGAMTDETFVIGVGDNGGVICYTNEQLDSHKISIYLETQNGIVIKDPLGRSVTYGEYGKIRLTRANGEKTIFSEGEAVDGVEIALDFSNGNQIITAEDGTFINSAIIHVPDELKPSNIVKDVEIAGVVGTFEGSGGSVELDEGLKYFVYQIDEENKEIILYGILYSKLYADTGSYDVSIPDSFGAYSVVINAAGVV